MPDSHSAWLGWELPSCKQGRPGSDFCFPNAHWSELLMVLLWALAQAVPTPPPRTLSPDLHMRDEPSPPSGVLPSVGWALHLDFSEPPASSAGPLV